MLKMSGNSLDYCNSEQLNWFCEFKDGIEKGLKSYCRFIYSQKQGKEEYGTKSGDW